MDEPKGRRAREGGKKKKIPFAGARATVGFSGSAPEKPTVAVGRCSIRAHKSYCLNQFASNNLQLISNKIAVTARGVLYKKSFSTKQLSGQRRPRKQLSPWFAQRRPSSPNVARFAQRRPSSPNVAFALAHCVAQSPVDSRGSPVCSSFNAPRRSTWERFFVNARHFLPAVRYAVQQQGCPLRG